ncbi:MAG: hypothetical protein KC549_16685, partial [Myxococcales bacterium]|nr:hypothetical protein [Myxococcales bacterium]
SGLTGVALVATSEDRDAQLAGAAIGAVGALALVTGGLLIGAASVPEDEPGVTITPLGVSGRF